MLATLLLVLMTAVGPIEIRLPMPTLATCEAYMADPAPIVARGAVPLRGAEFRCLDEPSDPGKPA